MARQRHMQEQFSAIRLDRLLHRQIFTTLWEARAVIEDERTTHKRLRPHSALGVPALSSHRAAEVAGSRTALRWNLHRLAVRELERVELRGSHHEPQPHQRAREPSRRQ